MNVGGGGSVHWEMRSSSFFNRATQQHKFTNAFLIVKEHLNNLTCMMIQDISQGLGSFRFYQGRFRSYRTGKTEKGKWVEKQYFQVA